ncbi:acetyl ornithine aminotransferase family protein [Deinococcus maricopensis]|uniref:Acetylornithine/succinyldiaminopimelateamino transferase n=1 Tax=Deinococcus maricopensis (strain DSM 21211 / LMG 22137 / NRRL B-23946 / LB-34) TaxID=709986 RepID=E8U988_DEIML|nr:acetyl ornithine aminotransferase family protein [Deinococcus maricopensis]ADV67627.1 Acetylornithine/succinyldiaminopimelateamino transferase [Deinococcus maricopensis DSM 21211]
MTATTARQPELKTALPGPNTKAIMERDAKHLSTSYMRPYPFVPDRGEGVWLTDVDGNTMLDFFAGIAVSTTGHAHPHVVQAVQAQIERFAHVCLTDYPQEITTSLAERLVRHVERTLPDGRHEKWRVFLGNSGAEAVEAAVKLARNHTGRSHIISTIGSFHGRTYGAITLTGSKTKYKRGFGPLLPNVSHVPYPNPFRPPLGSTAETCGQAVLNYLEDVLFQTVIPADEVAAIIVEPMQGEGGYIVPPADFLPGLRALCDRHGIMLIFDEVQAGMGRTGKMFSYQNFDGVQPDIITLAKGIASGLPISAMMAKESVMTWPVGSHGSTFGGNPVAAAAAHATLDLLEGAVKHPGCGDNLMDNARTVGDYILSELRDMQTEFPFLGDVRGQGLFIGLEFVKPDGSPDGKLRDAASMAMFERGLLNLDCGESVIRISPPLILTREDAETGLNIMRETLRSLQ